MVATKKKVTAAKAHEVLAAVKEQYKSYVEPGCEPTLYEPGTQDDKHWTIAWEDGPYEWAMRAFQGEFDQEVYTLARDAGASVKKATALAMQKETSIPKGVWVEPIRSWLLGIYPE